MDNQSQNINDDFGCVTLNTRFISNNSDLIDY